MGSKWWRHALHVICIDFELVPLRTHANISKSLLKRLENQWFTAESLGLARTSHGLTMTFYYFNRSYELAYSHASMCTGFKWEIPQTHADGSNSSNHILEHMQFGTSNQQKGNRIIKHH